MDSANATNPVRPLMSGPRLLPLLLPALSSLLATSTAVAAAETGFERTAAGKGPDGRDNGQIHACTGIRIDTTAVICVRAGAAGGGNGSAATPLASINAAITAAKAGDIVQVAAGTYAENVRLGTYASPTGKDLTLLGGFRADFAVRDAATHISTIDGGLLDPAVQLHVDSAQTSVLDGFRITRGRGLGNDYSNGYGHGGGVHVQRNGNGQTIVSHNEVVDNETRNHTNADSRGGGIHAQIQAWGGATGSVRIEDNLVRGNHAGKGAGINVAGSRAVLLRNRVEDNIGHGDHGGGIYVSTLVSEVRDNVIRANVTGASAGYGWGGGIIVAAAGAELSGNLVSDNFAPTTGAGLFWDEGAVGSMRNDLVVGNRCPQGNRSGAALYLDGGPGGPSTVTLENVTVADHVCPGTAPDGAAIVVEGGSVLAIGNSILHGNSRDFRSLSGGSITISHSITREAGIGNFDQDPLFADPGNGNYHLRSTAGRLGPHGWVHDAVSSPAIDAGDPGADFSRETVPNGGRVNLGAYGNTPEASRSGGSDLIFASGFD